MKATKDTFDILQAVAPAARTASVNGTVIDLANYLDNSLLIHPGTITDGTHTPKVQEGTAADGSDMADVAAADLVGALVAIASNTLQKCSYIGSKRYVRLVITAAGTTTGGVYGAMFQGKSRKQP